MAEAAETILIVNKKFNKFDISRTNRMFRNRRFCFGISGLRLSPILEQRRWAARIHVRFGYIFAPLELWKNNFCREDLAKIRLF